MHEGDSITTLEGLGQPEKPPSDAGRLVQQTIPVRQLHAPARILSSVAISDEIKANNSKPCDVDLTAHAEITPVEIRERMTQHLSLRRLSNIVEAITEVAGGSMRAFSYERVSVGRGRAPGRLHTDGREFIAAAPISWI